MHLMINITDTYGLYIITISSLYESRFKIMIKSYLDYWLFLHLQANSHNYCRLYTRPKMAATQEIRSTGVFVSEN